MRRPARQCPGCCCWPCKKRAGRAGTRCQGLGRRRQQRTLQVLLVAEKGEREEGETSVLDMRKREAACKILKCWYDDDDGLVNK